jgi:hypothetical protein
MRPVERPRLGGRGFALLSITLRPRNDIDLFQSLRVDSPQLAAVSKLPIRTSVIPVRSERWLALLDERRRAIRRSRPARGLKWQADAMLQVQIFMNGPRATKKPKPGQEMLKRVLLAFLDDLT